MSLDNKPPSSTRYLDDQDVLQHAEQCNGSGDCRKTALSGGTMCPSFMATRNEKDTTRARANILREFLTHSDKVNRFNHKEIYEVMDLCLSCKGCKSECPSNVDMAKLKAEFLQHYYDENGVPLRSRLIANFATLSKLGSLVPGLYNFMVTNKTIGGLIKKTVGFAPNRSLPTLHNQTLAAWFAKHPKPNTNSSRKVYLFCDEFTNYNDTEIGIKAILLLEKLGYDVSIPKHVESGRASMSKGLIRDAKKFANTNVVLLSSIVNDDHLLIGIEPSAILCFRDEYPDLVDDHLLEASKILAKRALLIDEFLAQEMSKGNIDAAQFTQEKRTIQLHGHCQQKSVASMDASLQILAAPANYQVSLIPSGCCGMAGSFGYEKEHFELSQQISELVLLPTIRKQAADVLIAATGTSCRHQIKDGVARKAQHPVEILYEALA
jgi:Fe-S oxidoreductase